MSERPVKSIHAMRWIKRLGVLAMVAALAISPGIVFAEETEQPAGAEAPNPKEDKTDYVFGGQILTLTEPQADVVPTSDNPRKSVV